VSVTNGSVISGVCVIWVLGNLKTLVLFSASISVVSEMNRLEH
jgi:hypothetical protein